MSKVTIVGGGPAGAMAALSALHEGADVTLYEKSRFPRHKVCGEFLSGEAVAVSRRTAVWDKLEEAGAVPIRRLLLQVGERRLEAPVQEPLHGLSRFSLDSTLLTEVELRGGSVERAKVTEPESPAVMAVGRSQAPPDDVKRSDRLFGFKAHFTGPVKDAVELYLFNGCYVGVSPVEGGRTNVCGLAPLRMLGEKKVNPENLIQRFGPLRDRLSPLRREWDWLATGPVTFGWRAREPRQPGIYPAGDALGFVDPFTGAGQSIAMIEGVLAGRAAVLGHPVEDYLRDCRRVTRGVFASARIIRLALDFGVAEVASRFLRPEWLFHLTRPSLVGVF